MNSWFEFVSIWFDIWEMLRIHRPQWPRRKSGSILAVQPRCNTLDALEAGTQWLMLVRCWLDGFACWYMVVKPCKTMFLTTLARLVGQTAWAGIRAAGEFERRICWVTWRVFLHVTRDSEDEISFDDLSNMGVGQNLLLSILMGWTWTPAILGFTRCQGFDQ